MKDRFARTIVGDRRAHRAIVHGVLGAVLGIAAIAGSTARGASGPAVQAAAGPKSSSATSVVARPQRTTYLQRDDVRDYIDELVASGRFERGFLTRVFADAQFNETSSRLMSPAATTGVRRDWNVYRARFVEPVRLAAGLRFWDANAAWLAKAEADFGVPPEIIIGILGCETVYGRNTGSLRVIDTLTTLSFDFPVARGSGARDRSSFFREQLGDALAMGRDGIVDLRSLRGSYAGAIGMPQFMPGSIQDDAVDYDGDGRIDLVNSAADVIGSVANYLARRGWIRNLPTHVALNAPFGLDTRRAATIDRMVDAGSVPSFTFSAFADAGFVAVTLPPDANLALIDLPAGVDARGVPTTSYVAGTQNFHVVTRYNRSYFYALSVIELGETIKSLRDARTTLEASGPTSR